MQENAFIQCKKSKIITFITTKGTKEMEAWAANMYWLPCISICYTERESTVLAHI